MRYYLWSLVLLPLVVLLICYFIIRKDSLDFIHAHEIIAEGFTDNATGGTSIADLKKNPESLHVRCVLQDGYEFPYSGIQFQNKDESYFDLTGYDVSIHIKANYDSRISFRFSQFIDGYTDTAQYMSYLFLSRSFSLKEGMNEIEFKVDDIQEIPEWWLLENLSVINRIDNIPYNKCKLVWLYTESTTPLNKPLDLDITEFKLTYSFLPFLYRFSVIAFLYYLILIVVIWKVKKVKYILMPIETSKIGNRIPETQADILSYIGENYKNSELKLYDVAQHVKISQDNVSELIRKHTNLTFRQYLNQVRLEEAKRLVRSTKLQIVEIAYEVGYNNVQHFNRVFKNYTSFTPKEFREFK